MQLRKQAEAFEGQISDMDNLVQSLMSKLDTMKSRLKNTAEFKLPYRLKSADFTNYKVVDFPDKLQNYVKESLCTAFATQRDMTNVIANVQKQLVQKEGGNWLVYFKNSKTNDRISYCWGKAYHISFERDHSTYFIAVV